MSSDSKDNDLPLVSNIKDILIKHYIFDFSCSFAEKCFICQAVLILTTVISENELTECCCAKNDTKNNINFTLKEAFENSTMFLLILDCHKIIVDNVEEIILPDFENIKNKGIRPKTFTSKTNLCFLTDKWSLKIWKKENACKFCFPNVIRISYTTSCDGPSLLWVRDQDKNPAVFTYGAWINNRSLFPCQEPPSAMATWEATVSVDNPCAVVLMSGDEVAQIKTEDERTYFYYFTKSVLPLSTLCLAVGFWEEHPITSKYSSSPKCRIFAPPSLLNKSVQELFEYIPYCLMISEDMFGPYPFPRVDVLIVPATFGSLGMASPNLVFLSQSLLSGDLSMCSRVAHEIVHGWFGLLIGALDWTEEWLSEGFATFMEDFLHVRTMNMSSSEEEDYINVKTYIRLKTLLQEIDNTNEDLQILRASKGETVSETVDGIDVAVLKNGQNPMKAFIQVHYIKGYFLLKHLANIVTVSEFLVFLRHYIEHYRGKLVTSNEFLMEYFSYFPYIKITMEEIYETWLHNSGIIPELKNMKLTLENKMYAVAEEETQKWKKLNCLYIKYRKKRRKFDFDNFTTLTSEQLILLLENMLEEPLLSTCTLRTLDDVFKFSSQNAEVQHRWLELVVKYKYKKGYKLLNEFLSNHLAMGVYLYGEMIFSGDNVLRKMAEETYASLKAEMEPNYVCTIDQMIENSE